MPSCKAFWHTVQLQWVSKMAAVSELSFKQRAMIDFFLADNEIVGNIHKWLKNVCGNCAVNRSTVNLWAKWVIASEGGQAKLCDLPHSGCPATAVTSVVLQCADFIIHKDRCITNRQLALRDLNWQKNCQWDYPSSQIFEDVREVGSSKPHIWT